MKTQITLAVLVSITLAAPIAVAQADDSMREVQSALKDKGIDPGPLDGLYGPKTKAAVTTFQGQEGLKETGWPDKATKRKLGIGGGGGESVARTEKVEAPADTGGGKLAAVAYPRGYREWHHVKSMIIHGKEHPLFDPFGGIHHVYVNDKGIAALKGKKGEFPTGTVFVFDLLEADQSGGAVTEGKRKFVAAMVRDANKYKETEGWGWQVFEGGDASKPVIKDPGAARACATCHKEVSTKEFVFAEYRQ